MVLPQIFRSPVARSALFAVMFLIRAAAVLMMAAGAVSFLLGGQHGSSSYDYTQRLNEPQPICSGQVQAEGGRVYVFSEELCAVNAYTESGKFLFFVRGNRSQNGQSSFFVLEDLGIYIASRNHILYRFDEDGTYLGRAEGAVLYHRDGTVRETAWGRVVLFADDWYCYEADPAYPRRQGFYLHSREGAEEYLGTAEELTRDRTRESDGPHYFTVLNSLYVSQNGEIIRLARTPLYLTFFYSPFLGFFTMVAGKLILHLLGKVSFPKTSRPEQPGPPPKTRSSQVPGDEIQ